MNTFSFDRFNHQNCSRRKQKDCLICYSRLRNSVRHSFHRCISLYNQDKLVEELREKSLRFIGWSRILMRHTVSMIHSPKFQQNRNFGVTPFLNCHIRLAMMSPSYLCGKPCSRGTHNEAVKNLALFFAIINGIVKESRLRISIPWKCFQFPQLNQKFYHIYTVTIAVHKSRNRIGTLEIAKFWPK